MRDDAVEMSIQDMDPLLRSLIAYEANGAMDIECPMKGFADIVTGSPIVRWEMGVGFFNMADVVSAGNNAAVVSTNPATGEPMGMGTREPLIPLHIDGDIHRRYRRLIDPLFAPKRIAHLEEPFRKLADQIIDQFIDAGRVELFSQYAVPLPDTMFMQLFGAPMADVEFFMEMKNRILRASALTHEAREVEGRAAGDLLRVRLRSLLAQRKAEGALGDDLISTFLSWEIDGERLTDDDIINIMHLFVIAGLDTVTSSISCLMGWLARHPVERQRLMDDPSLVPAAVEELMRYECPVPSAGGRWATENFDVNGFEVRKGEMIYLSWATANVDPAAFVDPLSVDIDRAENRHIAFAAGKHRCLGSHLARLELRVAIDQFHRRVSDYSIAPGEEPQYVFEGVRQVRHLPLVFTAR